MPPSTNLSFTAALSSMCEQPPTPSVAPTIVPAQKNDMFYALWDKFSAKPPPPRTSEMTSLDLDIENHPSHQPRRNSMGITSSENASVSFEEAKVTCKSKVEAIVEECRRLNLKHTDPDFRVGNLDTLLSLSEDPRPDSVNDENNFTGSVKRIGDIFDEPRFFVDGATANDVRQGKNGDCWFLAAVTALSGTEEKCEGQLQLQLLTKLCVAKDEEVGVYGFVFHRDGEWISEIVDDRLCLTCSVKELEAMRKEVRQIYSKGSDALYFSSCKGSNETWLPLLEKAFAKAHGDYQSINSGLAGEGIEDLTGGVNVSIDTEDILDKDHLWEELLQVNKEFLFGCSSRRSTDESSVDEDGLVRSHAYTVLEAREVGKERLLKLRNPWGNQEFGGPYSDGSIEWTPELMKELNHKFEDDGLFWIRLSDFLQYYRRMDRTRLFGAEWTITQQWTSVQIPYNTDYLPTRFTLDVKQDGPLVIVLSKPDQRYFSGFEGRYQYDLHFRLYREGQSTFLLRSISGSGLGRSCSAEVAAKKGRYIVFVKVTVDRSDMATTTDEVIRKWGRDRKEKVMAVGRSFDRIHSKGRMREMENEITARKKDEVRGRNKDRDITRLKAQRAHVQEEKRKERLRMARIDKEMKRKKAEMKAKKGREIQREQVGAGTEKVNEPPRSADTEDHKNIDLAGLTYEETKTIATIQVQDSKFPNPESTTPGDATPSEPEDDDNASVSAVGNDDFPWESDLDNPVDPVVIEDLDDAADDQFVDDPWNAICVIGLRVYTKGEGTKIEVSEN